MGGRITMKKCPICKANIVADNKMIIEREYITKVLMCENEEEIDVDKIASGYTDLYEWIENMLCRSGTGDVILGCEECV